MDQVKIGKAIKTLRLKLGYTQRDLADHLNVTDKAVSKWERGLGVPDISIVTALTDLLNIDADNLLDGNITFLEREWKGVIFADCFHAEFSADSLLYDKPIVYLYISLFLLVGIREITICSGDQTRNAFQNILDDGSGLGIHLVYQNETDPIWESNLMVLEDSIFLYGTNLTKCFQKAMSRDCGITELVIPNLSGNFRSNGTSKDKNLISHVATQEPSYEKLPLWFIRSDIAGEAEHWASLRNLRKTKENHVLYLGKGMVTRELRTYADLLETAGFVRFLQNNTGYYVYQPEEIAWRRGLISGEQMLAFAKGDPERERYLKRLLFDSEKK